jgi:hypothetical protein
MAGVAASWTIAATVGAMAVLCAVGLNASYACHDSGCSGDLRTVDVNKLLVSLFFDL